jgi:RNA-binding protein
MEQIMSLSEKQKRHLKKLVHHLKPVVIIGQNGLTEGVFNELESALTTHELIKIRLGGGDKAERIAMLEEICSRAGAEAIQQIGHVAALFRRNPKKPKVLLPVG